MSRFSSQPSWWPVARQQQLVHGDAPDANANEPSALVIAMAMLGVLVCIIPLGIFVALSLGERTFVGVTGLLLGLLVLAAGGTLLRKASQVFTSCVALVLWTLGGALLMLNVGVNHSDSVHNMLMLCTLAAALLLLGACLSSVRWIQVVMGVGWGAAVYGMLFALQFRSMWLLSVSLGSEILALLWLLWLRGEAVRLAQSQRWWAQPRWAVFADAAVVGLLCITAIGGYSLSFFGIAFSSMLSNSDFLAHWHWVFWLRRGLDVAAALFATALLIKGWKQRGLLSQGLPCLLLLAGGLLALCAWFNPSLGVLALLAAGALLSARWRIAVLCALVALSSLGRFYYQLNWPLAIKGIGIAALGCVLLVGVLWSRKGSASKLAAAHEAKESRLQSRSQLGWVLLGALLVFALVNWDVRGKEQVIAHGQRILVPLEPVDPRSLMQGDYMDLRFNLPPEVRQSLNAVISPVAMVIASTDAQGVATIRALADDRKPLQDGEILLPLKKLKGRWTLVTDAYFFPEGQGTHFSKGRFGDFRVLADGRALLVGLADAQHRQIKPLPGGSIWEKRPASERLQDEAAKRNEQPGSQLDPDSEPQTERPASDVNDAKVIKSADEARRAADEAQKALDEQARK